MSDTLRLFGSELTAKGLGHEHNADGALIREDLGLFAVVRGSGGQQRGALASPIVLACLEEVIAESIEQTFSRPDRDVLGIPEQAKRLSSAVHQAHARLRAKAEEDPNISGLSAGVTVLLESPRRRELHLASVGDCRCYRLRHGRVERLTRDDTLAEEVLEMRPDTPESVLLSLQGHSVVRALGLDQTLRVAITTVELAPADRFLICSHGLHGTLGSDALLAELREKPERHLAVKRLVEATRLEGGTDDITALLVDVVEFHTQEELATRPYNERPEP
jgi:protein phosphatase